VAGRSREDACIGPAEGHPDWLAEVTTFGEPAFTTGRASALASGLVFARDPAGQEVTLRVDLRDTRTRIRG
jgi:hypothetical protein